MNDLVLTYPTLFEQAMNYCDEKIIEIKKTIEHYERLKMPEKLIRQTKRGAIACLLKEHGMQMLRGIYYTRSQIWELFTIEENGTENIVKWDGGYPSKSGYWNARMLKDFDRPVPLEFLEKLPDSASEKSWVFYPREMADPILAYPLMYQTRGLIESITKKRDLFKREITRREVIEVNNFPGPFFAGIFKWN